MTSVIAFSRGEVLLTPLSGDRYNGTNPRSGDAAIIVGTHKLIVGNISQARPISWLHADCVLIACG